MTTARTTTDEFERTLSSAVTPPAVGAPLPFEGIELPEKIITDLDPTELRRARTGVTPAGIGVAEYGTIAIQSRPEGDEPISLYPGTHVAVVRRSDIVPKMADALDWFGGRIDDGEGSAVFTTGPSSTGDMGALIRGVHGPANVYVIVVTDR